MKKLTAGILTVMLGIVAANSADASIASRGYVDAQVGTKVSTSDFEAFKGTNTTAIADAKQAGTDASNALNAYKTEASNTFATQSALSEGLGTKQNTLTADDFVKDGTGNVVTGVTVGTDGKIKYTTASVTTSEDFGKLQTTVAGHTTQLSALTGDGDGSVAKSIAKAISDEVTRANAAYATAAQGAKADTAVQPDAITDMETQTHASATYATKTEMNTVDSKFANYTTTTDMNTALDAKADKSTIGNVESGKTVVQMIADAKQAASGDTTALQARVKTIEDSDVMASGATKAKIDAIETNTAGVAANKTAVEKVAADVASLGTLAKAAPGECASSTKKCALVFDGTNYAWEVIERDTKNE